MSFLYKEIDGCKLPFIFSEERLNKIKNTFVTKKEDVIICSNFRSGSTLLQYILNMLINNTKITDMNLEWLECGSNFDNHIYKSHYSFDKLPIKEINPETRIIYIQRDPKDVCVSMFEYYKSCKWINFKGDFNTFFNLFMYGKLMYDRWDKHIQSFKNADHNILFITYEDLINNKKQTILDIIKYLELNISSKKIKNIVKVTDFKYMKKKNRIDKDVEKRSK